MNLVIDAGNTSIKIGVFQGDTLLIKEKFNKEFFEKKIKEIKNNYPLITRTIVSSVAHLDNRNLDCIKKSFEIIELDFKTKMPFKNLYATPKTLGVDRLALTANAVCKYPGGNVLIIDAGTCITYDFKNNKEEYFGGAIAPGIQLRYKSLHQFTANLPLLTIKEPEDYIGKTTKEAMHSGVIYGVLHEIDGVISYYCNTYSDLTVILTGGDAHFLSKRLKNSIFAAPNFLLEGLNYILAFNNNK